LGSTKLISAASAALQVGLMDFISFCPAFQRSVFKMVDATLASHPNGSNRAANGESISETTNDVTAVMASHSSCLSCERAYEP
jgi:hypothetical protein